MNNRYFNYILIFLVVVIIAAILFIFSSPDKKDITFTINQDNMTLRVGSYKKINYSISDTTLPVTWESNDPNIAMVDNDGVVNAKNNGTTVISGIIDNDGEQKSIACIITVKAPNYDVALEDFDLPEGEILLSTNEEYQIPITYYPIDGYINSINYIIENDSIISVNDGIITGISPGSTFLNIIINDSISKRIKVNVTNNKVTNNIIKPIDQIILQNESEILYTNESKQLVYNVEPVDGNIFDVKWESSNPTVATVSEDGIVKGLNNGDTTIELTINNSVKKTISIAIRTSITEIRLDYNPKEIIKVGESFTLYPTVLPSNTPNQKIIYESNNPSVLSVSSTGTVVANANGVATITIKNEDGSVSKKVSFNVLNSKGTLNTNNIIWTFSKSTDVIPQRADKNFFIKLTQKGKGTFNNDTYVYQNYSYNTKTNLLTIGGSNKIYMRLYYPADKDLSTLNTFTFIGGSGEVNFSGYFRDIDRNPSLIKNSGIVILIPESDNAKIQGKNVAQATEFVKAIINQNKHARNAIGGYSNGGPPSGDAGNSGHYDKYMLINTSFYWVNTRPNVKNMEYVIYTARNDSWRGTGSFINELYNYGVKNITIVTNNSSFISSFQGKYLVINPGNSMKEGHTSENLTLSHFFSYALD